MTDSKVKGDSFSDHSQLTARRDGTYWQTVKQVESEKCVFCDLRDKYIITRNDSGVLTVNIFPYIDGQLLVIPTRHLETYSEIKPKGVLGLHELILEGERLLNQVMGIDNIWLIIRDGNISGKTVKHLHWNIMPYKEGMNTWNYDFSPPTIKPIDMAQRLRNGLKNAET